MGQIWDFLRSVSVYFGSESQNVLKLILKSPRFVPFGANMTQFIWQICHVCYISTMLLRLRRKPANLWSIYSSHSCTDNLFVNSSTTNILTPFFCSRFSRCLFNTIMYWYNMWGLLCFDTILADITRHDFPSIIA